MNEPLHFDLVAIGGGFAGLCTAVRGAELGLRTAMLEAGTDESYPCSSALADGNFSHLLPRRMSCLPGQAKERQRIPQLRPGLIPV
jgi:glycine/D-amino acid oxidase-like deaminating enzyme